MNGVPRSDVNTNGDLVSCSRCSRLKARNSLPVNACVAGLPFLSLRMCRQAHRLTSLVRFGVTVQGIGNGYSIGYMPKCWESLGKMA